MSRIVNSFLKKKKENEMHLTFYEKDYFCTIYLISQGLIEDEIFHPFGTIEPTKRRGHKNLYRRKPNLCTEDFAHLGYRCIFFFFLQPFCRKVIFFFLKQEVRC